MLHSIGDFERLGDHAVNLLRTAQEIRDKHIVFSEPAEAQLYELCDALKEILALTVDSFTTDNCEMAHHVEPLEQVIDVMASNAKSDHVERLQQGRCTIQSGFVWSDLLTNFERVGDHCSNIAVALIETSVGSFGTHRYLNSVKKRPAAANLPMTIRIMPKNTAFWIPEHQKILRRGSNAPEDFFLFRSDALGVFRRGRRRSCP